MQSEKGRYTFQNLDDWDPLSEDYNSLTFNSYSWGPGANLPVEFLPPRKMLGSVQQGDAKKVVLFVKGVPPGMEKEGLKNLFAPYGRVLYVHIGQSRNPKYITGYGMVHLSSLAEAETAIRELHKKPPLGLIIEFAQTNEERKMKLEMKKAEMNHYKEMSLNRIGETSVKNQSAPLVGNYNPSLGSRLQSRGRGATSSSL
ncbi:uncharacterized protein LOC106470659, partial [Limulus polyphemus]|uniref:Uncharacterized protein LOC106470659 n=1 Tax=Limulus polyphemus TaxID=6850 RepID=A0ABM1TGJ1_LIMPO